MKSIIKRRKSNVQEQLPIQDRPREHIPAVPRPRSRLNDHVLRAPTPTRFSGAGWEEFLTNISTPQPPLTPLSQSPSTPNARLPGTRDTLNPIDDAFRSSLGPAFAAPQGTSQPGAAPAPDSPGGSAGPGRAGIGAGQGPRSPGGFTNAHMMPPSSPALTNALGSPIASPKQADRALYPAESRFPLGIASVAPRKAGDPFGLANSQPHEPNLPASRLPLAPSSPLRSPLSGPSSPLAGPDDAHGTGTEYGGGRGASAQNGRADRSRSSGKDPDQSDSVSVKSSVSSSSKKGRSISRFFKRNKANSNDWPDDILPAMPTTSKFAGFTGGSSSSPASGPNASPKSTRAKGAGPLSPPASYSSHPIGGPGAAGGGAVQQTPRQFGASPTASGPSAVPNGIVSSRATNGQNEAAPQGGARGPTTVDQGAGRFFTDRPGVESPPQTGRSTKTSTEQPPQSQPSVTTSPVKTAPAKHPTIVVPTSDSEVEQAPKSPAHLLPMSSPMLRTQSSQSSLRKLLADMNLPLVDDSTPIVTLSDVDGGKEERILEEGVRLPPSPSSAPPAARAGSVPNGTATAANAATPQASSAKSVVVDEDGTDSIAALHSMLGSFDMVTPFDAGLQLTQFGSDRKPEPVVVPTRPPHPDERVAQGLAGLPPQPTLLAAERTSGERRGSENSSTHSDAFRTPPEQPGTPKIQTSTISSSETATAGQSPTATPTYSRTASIASIRRPMNAPPVMPNGSTANGRPAAGSSGSVKTTPPSSSIFQPGGGPMPNSRMTAAEPDLVSSQAEQQTSPRRVRVILPAPKPRPEGVALAELIWTHTSVSFVQRLISLLDFNDIKSLRQTSRAYRNALNTYPCKEIILRRFLGQVGYRSWARQKAKGAGQGAEQPAYVPDPIPLSFSDAEGFLLSHHLMSEYALVSQAYLRDPQAMDPRMLTLARATTRAYNRVLSRLRAQPLFAIPPQRNGTTDSSGVALNGTSDALPSPWKPGRAALFQVWVPCASGSWLSDEELTRCEAELFKAGIWNHLKRGDVVWDCALGEEGNMGRLIFDGQFLRDLSFTFDPIGHLPSWLNILSFSPAHFHGRIRSSTGAPVVFIDMTPFREQIGATLHLVQDSAETVSPNGTRYKVQRWMYRAKVKVTPGTIISNYGLDCVHIDWAGTITIETEGTIEHARDLITRCFGPNSNAQARLQLLQAINKGPLPPLSGEDKWSYSDKSEATSPFEIVRAKSKPGQLFVRPVIKAPQNI
ncbi:hypothetical protein OC834_002757 [Tilletia horrida]|nr:hypothetical protein OC834_002757 [Tilletia horrida]